MRYLILTVMCLLFAVGCKEESAPPAPTASVDQLPANLFTTTAPPGALDVAAARAGAKDGAPVVIKGRIAGTRDPIAANRAIMTVADLTLPTCDQTPGDTCATPWDACCEPKEEISAKSISVQVLGQDGRPLKSTLGGAAGIAPMKQIVVAGTMRITPGSDTPIIEAKQIYVQP